MTRFTTDHLKTFVTVIEYGTFDAAADVLGVSPSAISQRVKTMEQLAGKVLLATHQPGDSDGFWTERVTYCPAK